MNFDILQSYAMSNTDIFKIIGKSTVIKYPDLANKKSIFECFDSRNRCVLFFETVAGGVGHWECMFYIPSTKTIHFFDSYGIKQDGAEKFINLKVEDVFIGLHVANSISMYNNNEKGEN